MRDFGKEGAKEIAVRDRRQKAAIRFLLNRSKQSKQRFPFGFLSVTSVISWSMPLAFQFAKEPGPGVGPVVVGGARGDAENLGGFLESPHFAVDGMGE
jgi:hypothetical protein